jgi:hypothetical protein
MSTVRRLLNTGGHTTDKQPRHHAAMAAHDGITAELEYRLCPAPAGLVIVLASESPRSQRGFVTMEPYGILVKILRTIARSMCRIIVENVSCWRANATALHGSRKRSSVVPANTKNGDGQRLR